MFNAPLIPLNVLPYHCYYYFTGHMQWLYDLEGNRYLDMIAGIATVIAGHAHPKIQEVSHVY